MINEKVRLIFQHVHGGIYSVKRDSAAKYMGCEYVAENDVIDDLNRYDVTVQDKRGNVILESKIKR